MPCLITGATGFVGRYLLSELKKQNIDFFAPGREDFDYTDIEAIRSYFAGKDITDVIHLSGAVDTNDMAKLYISNIVGLNMLLQICCENNVKHFTYASSNVVYGTCSKAAHTTEDHPFPDTKNLYAVSKYAGELIVSDYCNRHGIEYANVRIADVYGPEQKTGNLIKAIINNVKAKASLSVYGDGLRVRDYIYVTDVARGLCFISQKRIKGTVNLGSGKATSVKELLEIADEISGFRCGIKKVSVDQEDTSTIWLDVSTLKKLGFSAEVSIKEGLRKAIQEG